MEWVDRSVIEAASWRLASELMRRHPQGARLIRGHPGGGQYDVLWIVEIPEPGGSIPMNRNGTIQVHGRFDGDRATDWRPTPWEEYLAADPREFLEQLERAAGWPAPSTAPATTPITLSYRVLAALAATGVKSIRPILIEQGFIDTSGEGGGPNPILEHFKFAEDLARPRTDDFWGEPGYRFWIAVRDHRPLLAVEQTSATAWFPGSATPVDMFDVYRASGRDATLVALELLRRSARL